MDQILPPKLTDLELEALRQIAVHPATRHIPYRVQSRLKDIGYAKEVLGGLVLTDVGLQRIAIDRERIYRGKQILRPGSWQDWDVAARCLLLSRLLRDSLPNWGRDDGRAA